MKKIIELEGLLGADLWALPSGVEDGVWLSVGWKPGHPRTALLLSWVDVLRLARALERAYKDRLPQETKPDTSDCHAEYYGILRRAHKAIEIEMSEAYLLGAREAREGARAAVDREDK